MNGCSRRARCRSTASVCSGAASRRSSTPRSRARSGRRVRQSPPDCSSPNTTLSRESEMTDVRDEAVIPAAANDRDSDRGSFIWYELMTTDPNAAKVFYDAVVGWDIDAQSAMPGGDMDYRMIKRGDGGFAGGVLGLTKDMETHGARPIWLGYVCVDNVDQALKDIESQGGKTMMPANDIPDVGRIAMISDPQGAPIYIMTPVPPASDPNAKSDVFSVDQPQHVRWNELSTNDPAGALDFYKRQFG